MTEQIDIKHLQQWIGKQQRAIDTVTTVPIAALRATLDYPDEPIEPGIKLPELWHWLYFLPLARQSDIGADGHPERGGFLPPVPLPRRMWAGSQFEFHQPIHIGDTIERTSTIENVTHKTGRSGDLVFVRVKHEIAQAKPNQSPVTTTATAKAMTEYHDIVYRQAPKSDGAPPAFRAAPSTADWEQLIKPDDVLLFRYSALTFNGHRIHYDRRYATEVEGYPGLIVHGPLIATLLLDALGKAMHNPIVIHYEFRAIKPVFDIDPFYVCGSVDCDSTHIVNAANANSGANTETSADTELVTVRLWAKDYLGDVAMEAQAIVKKNPV